MAHPREWRGRSSEPESTKEARFLAVAAAVAAIVERAGPAKLSVSAVARRAGVSRPWIYKYFGPDPDALLTHATTLYARQFADLARPRAGSDPAGWRAGIAEATLDGLRDAVAAPWCVTLYFRHRHAPDAVGAAIRDVEAAYVERFLAEMPPALRRDPAAARRFVEVFTSARLGAFHRWLDPAVRAAWTEAQMVAEVLRPLDAWARGI